MNDETLRDYILANERNLQITTSLSRIYPDVREYIATEFLNRLGHAVLEKLLSGWNQKLDSDCKFYQDPWKGISFFKPTWNGEYWVRLQFAHLGAAMEFGVVRNKDQIQGRPFSQDLLQAVKSCPLEADTYLPWWEARVCMRDPAPNWQGPEVLWRMHADESFLEEVKQQLVKLASVAGPIIDDLTRK